jgi:hypothetical protein
MRKMMTLRRRMKLVRRKKIRDRSKIILSPLVKKNRPTRRKYLLQYLPLRVSNLWVMKNLWTKKNHQMTKKNLVILTRAKKICL